MAAHLLGSVKCPVLLCSGNTERHFFLSSWAAETNNCWEWYTHISSRYTLSMVGSHSPRNLKRSLTLNLASEEKINQWMHALPLMLNKVIINVLNYIKMNSQFFTLGDSNVSTKKISSFPTFSLLFQEDTYDILSLVRELFLKRTAWRNHSSEIWMVLSTYTYWEIESYSFSQRSFLLC